jgi:clan AA aspartic protease
MIKQTNMGAVRTKVKLTNSGDEVMVSRGVLAPRHLRQYEGEALVDTGALTLVLPPAVVEQLGLRIQTQQVARYANGFEEPVGVTEPVIIECEGRQTAVQALVVGDEILIGQVVLELLDLLPDCRNQRLIPNPANPDYPVAIIK